MYAVEQARDLGMTGWVRNTSGGDVEIVAEGGEEDLRTLVEWCRQGPPAAEVSGVRVEYDTATGEFDSFRVVH